MVLNVYFVKGVIDTKLEKASQCALEREQACAVVAVLLSNCSFFLACLSGHSLVTLYAIQPFLLIQNDTLWVCVRGK